MNKDEVEQFLGDLCAECGIMDIRNGRDFYNGLQRFIIKNVREKGQVELPGIGKFSKTKNTHMNIVRYNVNTGSKENVFSESYVKFKIDRKLKLLCRDY